MGRRCLPIRNKLLIAVVLCFVGAIYTHADIVGLCLGERGEVYADALEVEACNLLVEVLGQAVYIDGIVLTEEFDLCQGLIGE